MKLPLLFIIFGALVGGPLRADIVNRWTFNHASGDAPNGTVLVDTVAGASAVVHCGTASSVHGTFTGTALSLPGKTNGNQTAANISAYLDLPNGIVSSKTNLTVEAWIKPLNSKTWQRLFDFGRSSTTSGPGAATGEIIDSTTAPGTYQAYDNLTLTLNNNGSLGSHRIEGRLAGGATIDADVNLSSSTAAGTEYQYVLTVTDGAGVYGGNGCQAAFYRNGVLQATDDLNFHLSQISDVNNWIGRSQYGSDSTSAMAIDELRIYNHAMSAAEVQASYSAGPNPAYGAPVANADSVTMHHGQKARVNVLANDTGTLSGPTVVIVQLPSFGTAVSDGTGRILYTHTTGAPATDTFTYRVSGPADTSAAATVTINFSSSLRIANSGLNVPANPPPLATQIESVLTGLSQPICFASPPADTKRLFFCEKDGLLRMVPDMTAGTLTVSTFLDLPAVLASRGESLSTSGEQGLLGLAFHPNYATNGFFYVFYSVSKSGGVFERVSRFSVQSGNPNAADTASERVLIEQLDPADNHNGGDIHFGPDGYLYVSLGDGGNQNDSLGNAQHIDKNFFSGVLRIDIDKRSGNLEPNPQPASSTNSIPRDGSGHAYYSVPVDNPFVGATTFNGVAITAANVRSEFWAVGMRNPWRFSFDATAGELWLGDVGQDTYEEVDVVTKGGNYGWSYREAKHPGPRSAEAPVGFSGIDPLYEFMHTGVSGADPNFYGNCVIGGVVYRGTRFPSLSGLYIFCDYVSGNIWTLSRNGANPPTVTRLAGQTGIVAFGTDPSNGDVLMADLDHGQILRLTLVTATSNYPSTLSATGLFADLTDLSPAPGVLPYAPNLPFWSDYAIKSRWFTIPDGTSKMTWSRDGAWTFPAGQIWVKHFDLDTVRGDDATKKRIETRVLVKNATGVYGVSYQWNAAGTEATLVPDGGADFDVATTVNGQPYTQHWRIPSRAECLACHNPQTGGSLSFNTRQLNLVNTINGFAGNQLALLDSGGYFSNSPGSPNLLPRHLRPTETSFPSEARVRSYLAVNCAYCHQAGGTAPTQWDGRPQLTLDQTGLINGVATNNGGNAANKLVVPGDTTHSIVLNRIAVTNGFTRMPPLASNELDQASIALVTDWITNSLPSRQTFDDWRLAQFGSGTDPAGDPAADPDGDGARNLLEFLAGTLPKNGGSLFVPQLSSAGSSVSVTFNVPANRSATVQISPDLVNWSIWDVPGNAGLPTGGGAVTLTGPRLGTKQFFRVLLQGN